MDLAAKIRDIPDFPKPGIVFKDITTLIQDPKALKYAIDQLHKHFRGRGIDVVVAMESRGFIFGAPLAYKFGAGFVPVRKLGKLPSDTIRVEYDLEYGTNTVEMHSDAISPGQRVLIVDDLLATGGTAGATIKLVEHLGGVIVGIAFLIELTFLNGRQGLEKYDVFSLIQY
ncbi:MAG: adenine phosphoribosyltransferase [Chloroflexi bacterium]|nr:adenine phosphoribosyltransferase [Chloroflexota bacterium]